MKRRRDEPWHITNGCIGSACEYVNQSLLIRWFDREYVDERNDTCVLGNRSHEKSPASEREVAPDPHILCVSGRRHSRGDPKADTGHGLQLAGTVCSPSSLTAVVGQPRRSPEGLLSGSAANSQSRP